MKRPSGFSLVECVVASLLLSAGLLAITASGRAMQHLDLLGGRSAQSAEVAASRFAALRAQPCAGPSTGSASGILDERWSVSASGALRIAALEVSFVAANRSHTVHFESGWLCQP